jgi:tetratricopeptide (TPR) repeat protein
LKRLALIVALIGAIALPLLAAPPEKWFESYDRGVAAVRSRNYAAAVDALQRAVSEQPTENGALRAGNTIITYVPHFWLGIAKFNLGDIDASMREFKTSEDQGVVQSTQYYTQLREWVARAQAQKKRDAEASASDSKLAADAAISRALSGQMEAVAAGGDRSESYRGAKQKLQEALDQFNHAGTNIAQYKRASETAGQAHDLFIAAAEDAKKAKAARPPVVVKKETPPPPVTATVAPPPPQPPPAPIESEALVSARLLLQQYRRKLLESGSASASPALQTYLHESLQETYRLDHQLASKPSDADIHRVTDQVAIKNKELLAEIEKAQKPKAVTPAVVAPPVVRDIRADLELAYRAFATGDFDTAESLLTKVLATKPEPQAYALRGCARYTRGMLSRKPDALLASAAADFRAALKLKRDLQLDRNAFSPKLVSYFEAQR